MMRSRSRTGRSAARAVLSPEGSQLLEFAVAAPLLLVLVIGIFDFGSAYNLIQKLNNAAREGARYAANQSSNINDINTTSVGAIGTVVSNYLTNAGVTQCAIGAPAGGPLDYTFGSSGTGCGNFKLEVNRDTHIVANGTTYSATTVTITYPVTWSIGNVMKLFLPSSTLNSTLPATVVTDATVQNIF